MQHNLKKSLLTALSVTLPIICLGLVSLASLAVPAASSPSNNLNQVTTIKVDGAVNLTLIPAKSNSIKITPQDQHWISRTIKGNTLTIKTAMPTAPLKPTLYKATIGIKQLSRLAVYGYSSVSAKNLKTNGLNILADTNGTIKLDGILDISNIIAQGNSKLHLIWVNGQQLNCILSGNAKLQLAGTTQFLDARLAENSQLDAQYLRAKQVTVQTHGKANATIHADESLKAFAYDQSNIYYAKRPKFLSQFTHGAGNVLQSDWDR